jgi:acetoin utilization deacetylase AcuC-like enzyme
MEVPDRIENIKSALGEVEGVRFILPRRFPLRWIEQVHNHDYVDYIADAGREAGNTYVYPSVFPYQPGQNTQNSVARRGLYSFDTYTPVSSTTYEAARGSAMAALTAASLVRRGERVVYALCRPPGHHAAIARTGGYCYFNNAAIVANYLSGSGKVAVLDIDVHHGNGTQHIFYNRADVLTVSIHGDPNTLFPYFSGRANESGSGIGVGYNINYPLPLGTADSQYESVFSDALSRVVSFAPTYIVVALGYDGHIQDPIGHFALSTGYYRRLATSISRLGIPTVLVQEGGYNTNTLGEIAQNFVRGFIDN